MFGPSGIIRVENAFSADVAGTISDLIWDVLFRSFGIDRSVPETWGRVFKKRQLEEMGSSPVFDEILTDRLANVIDDLLGGSAWEWPASWGDFLITFPNAKTWTLPHNGWHQDWSFARDCDPPRFFKAFTFLNEVEPSGGGTLVVAGSHRLCGRFEGGRAVDDGGRTLKGSDRLYFECDWLRELGSDGDDAPRRRRFMDNETDVEGVGLKVVELTGHPGDVVIIHPWLIRAIAPNAAMGPRFMRAPVFGASG